MAIGLAFFGINAPIFYFLLVGLVIPVGISVRLHQLKEKSLVVIPKELSQWTVYVQGIPVQENRSVLTNPCFAIQTHLQAFFFRAFMVKGLIQGATLLMLIAQLFRTTNPWILPIGLFVAVWLVLKCIDTGKILVAVARQTWSLEEVTSETGTSWYRAGFSKQQQPTTALERLLAL
ncbi:hypothetical protein [Serratia sp. DD3]|uniref:hypothetical protein n=1 Tax=Serratia sp. DD3 TaxID=1410619 RepID=UPI0004D563C2|nr:hypothetical protein [Serratia sp. DD3]KEY59842.1 hypothetical protein SRDD_11810 [Serratia sp. DD3]